MSGPAQPPTRPPAGPSAGPPAASGSSDAELAEFDQEIRAAVRYERGLAVKAVIALAIVALVILIRLLFLG
ncbi:MAG TPA: hypothetical protein VHT94_02920 [Streptosporangiaceae bacterium]|nr:hypothetical protein [Streptosporangiaceae bacterium]